MGKIMLVTSGKGGTGKSTVAVNLALSLANKGKKSVVIELDSGLRCIDLMLGIDGIVYDLGDVLSGKCDVLSAVYEVEGYDGLNIIAASSENTEDISKDSLEKVCKFLKEKFDYVILDTPAGLGKRLKASAQISDSAIVVSTVMPVSIRDAEKAAGIISQYGVKDVRLVINMVPVEAGGNKYFVNLDRIIDTVGVRLIAVVSEDRVIRKSVSDRTNKDIRKSLAIKAFSNMADRVLGKDIPLLIK